MWTLNIQRDKGFAPASLLYYLIFIIVSRHTNYLFIYDSITGLRYENEGQLKSTGPSYDCPRCLWLDLKQNHEFCLWPFTSTRCQMKKKTKRLSKIPLPLQSILLHSMLCQCQCQCQCRLLTPWKMRHPQSCKVRPPQFQFSYHRNNTRINVRFFSPVSHIILYLSMIMGVSARCLRQRPPWPENEIWPLRYYHIHRKSLP